MCAVATADLLLCTPPTMAALASGTCTSDPPPFLLRMFESPARSCVFLSQLLPLLHAHAVSLADVAVPVLVTSHTETPKPQTLNLKPLIVNVNVQPRLQRLCFVGRKLAFRSACAVTPLQHQQHQQQQQQQDDDIAAPLVLSYTVPAPCNDTEHAAAAALCCADGGHLDPHLLLLLMRSDGVVPHASHFVSKHPFHVHDNGGLSDVLPADGATVAAGADDGNERHGQELASFDEPKIAASGVAAVAEAPHAHVEPGSDGLPPYTLAASTALQKTGSLLAHKKHAPLFNKLHASLASLRATNSMMNGVSWGERMCLQQFRKGKLVSVPFTAAAVHVGRIVACFCSAGRLFSVDSLGWMKWCIPLHLTPSTPFHLPLPYASPQAQSRPLHAPLRAKLGAGCCWRIDIAVCTRLFSATTTVVA